MHILFTILFAILGVWVVELTVQTPLELLNWLRIPQIVWVGALLGLLAWGLGD